MSKWTLVVAMAAVLVIALKPREIEARMTMPQLRNALKGVAKTCVGKTGVSAEMASKTKDGEFPTDRNLMCYFLCMYSGMKVVKDGRLNMDTMNKQTDMMMPLDVGPKVKEVSGKCNAQTTSDDDCERMFQFSKCYWEADPSLWLFP